MRRDEGYIKSRGGRFEHLLQMYSFAYNSQTNVSGHILIQTFFLVLVCVTRVQICPHPSVTLCIICFSCQYV
jgi:hypothetical protein